MVWCGVVVYKIAPPMRAHTLAHKVSLIQYVACMLTDIQPFYSSPSGEALKCIMCHGFHHMLCINPPMLKKPSKGFAFQCALCTKLAMDSSQSPTTNAGLLKTTTNNSASSSGQNTPRGSPKQKSQPTLTVAPSSGSKGSRVSIPSPPGPHEQKMSHMWPFRYFGTHADIQDIFGAHPFCHVLGACLATPCLVTGSNNLIFTLTHH